jgi:hypothetical protein
MTKKGQRGDESVRKTDGLRWRGLRIEQVWQPVLHLLPEGERQQGRKHELPKLSPKRRRIDGKGIHPDKQQVEVDHAGAHAGAGRVFQDIGGHDADAGRNEGVENYPVQSKKAVQPGRVVEMAA